MKTHFDPLKPSEEQRFDFYKNNGGRPMPGHVRGRHTQSDSTSDRTSYDADTDEGAYWRDMANTTEPSVCRGDAALRQITLTTCSYYYRHSQ